MVMFVLPPLSCAPRIQCAGEQVLRDATAHMARQRVTPTRKLTRFVVARDRKSVV